MFIHFLAIHIYLAVTQQWTISSGSIILASSHYVTVLLIRGIYEVRLEVTSGGMICIPSFMTIRSAISVILRLLPQQFQRLQCWYY
jgi:hypothetical protein